MRDRHVLGTGSSSVSPLRLRLSLQRGGSFQKSRGPNMDPKIVRLLEKGPPEKGPGVGSSRILRKAGLWNSGGFMRLGLYLQPSKV